MYGMVNMSLFLLIANYVAALVAAQLLRGDLPSDINMNFKEVYNSFLAMYQVLSPLPAEARDTLTILTL